MLKSFEKVVNFLFLGRGLTHISGIIAILAIFQEFGSEKVRSGPIQR
jgi:hypothetical protein